MVFSLDAIFTTVGYKTSHFCKSSKTSSTPRPLNSLSNQSDPPILNFETRTTVLFKIKVEIHEVKVKVQNLLSVTSIKTVLNQDLSNFP